MSYYSDDERITRNLARGPERERMLLAEAERLIEARAKKLHVTPRTLVNQLFDDEPETKPSNEDRERAAVVNALRERLAVRDRGGNDAVE